MQFGPLAAGDRWESIADGKDQDVAWEQGKCQSWEIKEKHPSFSFCRVWTFVVSHDLKKFRNCFLICSQKFGLHSKHGHANSIFGVFYVLFLSLKYIYKFADSILIPYQHVIDGTFLRQWDVKTLQLVWHLIVLLTVSDFSIFCFWFRLRIMLLFQPTFPMTPLTTMREIDFRLRP